MCIRDRCSHRGVSQQFSKSCCRICIDWTGFGLSLIHILEAVPALMTPVIILGGIYSGLLTATESAAVACVWAFIAGVFLSLIHI